MVGTVTDVRFSVIAPARNVSKYFRKVKNQMSVTLEVVKAIK